MMQNPVSFESFPQLLEARAGIHGERVAVTFASDDTRPDRTLTYSDLAASARKIAEGLSSVSAPGERALLFFAPGVDFVTCLLGCMYAGILATPVYPPRNERGIPRLHRIAADAGASLVLTSEDLLPFVSEIFSGLPDAPLCMAAGEESQYAQASLHPELTQDSLAVLQYTSGSTGSPKGVMLTHGNLLHNSAAIHEKFGCGPDSVAVIWLPPYHDMGLIGGILQPLFGGFPVVLLSPLDVLQRPRFWLESISQYRGTISGGPNFSYDLCVRKVAPEERDGLDLSSWEVAFNGAEPIRPNTLARFSEAFSPAGFRESSFYPCYGMAEATLLASGGRPDESPRTAVVEGRRHVVCGSPPSGHEAAVVDPDTLSPCPPGTVGEVLLRGPSVARGYWRKPEATADTFRVRAGEEGDAAYLRTGDLGAVVDGELVITGRRKELIVVAGRNIYPHDVESTVDVCHRTVRRGCGAAFALNDAGTERLAVVQEVRLEPGAAAADHAEVIAAIRGAVTDELDVLPSRVVLVPPGSVPKTSSGKLRRLETRRMLSEGALTLLASSDLATGEEPVRVEQESVTALRPAPDGLSDWLAGVVERAIGTPVPSAHRRRPLTDLGMDSLSALRIRHECQASLGRGPELKDLLQYDLETIAHGLLAAEADNVESGTGETSDALSAGETALWLLDRLDTEDDSYHLARAFRMRGRIDLPALRTAFGRVVAAHPALRSRYVEVGGVPQRVVDEEPTGWLSVVDATDWDDDRLIVACQEAADRRGDLSAGPLFRVLILNRGEGECAVVVTAHHILLDYWSFLLIVDRLRAEYHGETPPPPTEDYTGFVLEQDALLNGAEGERLARYWRERMDGAPNSLQMPVDRERSGGTAMRRGGTVHRELRTITASAIVEAAKHCGATSYSVLTAAWGVLLGAWTGQEELVVGCPTSGRGAAHHADVVGYFVNPLPLRIDTSGNPVFTDLVRQVHETTVNALAHQEYPFPHLVASLGAAGDNRRNPVFQTMSVHYRGPLDRPLGTALFALGLPDARMDWGELELENIALSGGNTQMDLTLAVAEDGDRTVLAIEHTDVLDPDTVEDLADRVVGVLDRLVEGTDQTVASLLRTTDTVRARAVSAPVGASAHECTHQWFEAAVAAAPDAVALVHPKGRLTYRELNRLANRVAHRLRAKGVGPEQLIGVPADRSAEMVVALLGVLKAGGAYLPLDEGHPQARLTEMRSLARPILVLGEQGLDIASLCAVGPEEFDGNPRCLTTGVSAAYVIFTSGSTGRPKGVLVEHGGLANLISAQAEAFGVGPGSTVLQYASASFDASVSEIFVTLGTGGTLRLEDPLALLPGPELIRILADGVTTVTLPPSVLASLPDAELPNLTTVVSAGEVCTADIRERWSPGRRLINAYGPTEATVCATIGDLSSDHSPAWIGPAMPGAAVYVLGPELDPVAPGEVGEVYIGGLGVARGYVNAPGHTAVRFVADLFSAVPGARMYRTGDRARLDRAGGLHFLGRTDDQVKLRGHRIEPGEVEAALRDHPRVCQAAVVARPMAGEQALVAFLTVDGAPSSTAELRAVARSRLPYYMVPAAFVVLPELPRNASGKIDRSALIELAMDRSHEEEYVAPETEQQRLVAEVWQEVLDIDRVGIDDNFFDLGAHSISAALAHSMLQDRVGWEFSLVEIFEFTTVRALSQRLFDSGRVGETVNPAEVRTRAQRRAGALARRQKTRGVEADG